MLKSLRYHPNMFLWRTRNQAEVDLVLELNGALYSIEVKMEATLLDQGCAHFAKRMKNNTNKNWPHYLRRNRMPLVQ